jgi:hypothetical protein
MLKEPEAPKGFKEMVGMRSPAQNAVEHGAQRVAQCTLPGVGVGGQ